MPEEETKFADAKAPVGWPAHRRQGIAIVEGLDVLPLGFVDDGAVVDAVDGDLTVVALIEKAVTLFAEFSDIDGGDVKLVLVNVEVGKVFWWSGSISRRTTFSGSWSPAITWRRSSQ
jgi:hypothetical protein